MKEQYLDALVVRYRRAAYATATKLAYKTQLRTYLKFCLEFSYTPVPVGNLQLTRYVAHLSTFLSMSSIPCYLSVIRLLHLESGFQNPLSNNYQLSSVLKGARRELAAPPRQMAPITPQILKSIYQKLDLSQPILAAFWAAALVAFYSLFRKSTLLPVSNYHNCKTELCRKDYRKIQTTWVLNVKHTKTLQYSNKLLQIPLPEIPGSVLCPIGAMHRLNSLSGEIPSHAPLFSYPVRGGPYSHLNHTSFHKLLRTFIGAIGLPPGDYSPHSFRRGGASFAFACGIPSDLIKIQGDWNSDAYLRYLSSPLSQRQQMVHVIAQHLQK